MSTQDVQYAAMQIRCADAQARLTTIRTIYDRYRHLNAVLSDPRWTQDEWGDDAELRLHHVLYDCWYAIKTACEGKEGSR